MQPLNAIISYWRDCIKAEGTLEQSFGVDAYSFALHERAKASLFKGDSDPFIFASSQQTYKLKKGRDYNQILKASLKGQDIYFGYPLLMFYDRSTGENHVAPLFTIRLELTQADKEIVLSRAESVPTLGSCAFTRLGLSSEEIVGLNSEVSRIFEDNKSSKLEVILYLLKQKTQLTFVEGIDPDCLSTALKVQPYDGTVVYNKAIFSIGDASIFNVHLLNDIEELARRPDLSDSALSYLKSAGNKNNSVESHDSFTPILPFAFDEYHLQAIKHILDSEHSVITGPPGTGKSQFIANLIVNLSMHRKRVLFVSHTGEAVRVVNERVNREFMHLMMQTGKKEIRQELGHHLTEMIAQFNEQQFTTLDHTTEAPLRSNWQSIVKQTEYLKRTNKLNGTLFADSLKQITVLESSSLSQRVRGILLELKIRCLAWLIDRRQSNSAILKDIEARKERHIEISKAHVNSAYLGQIFDNDLYGELVAYIDAVQNKLFNGTQDSNSDSSLYVHAALKAMNIWSCTLKSLGASFPLEANLFDYVIFDEASQIDLPSAAPALYRAKRSVVVGDENQLKHIAKINSKTEEGIAKKHNLQENSFYPLFTRYTDTSLFLSAKKALGAPELELKKHYRSNAQIANLFSSIFYNGKLKVIEPSAENLPNDMKTGTYWLDSQGSSYKHKAGSVYNSYEANYIVRLLEKLLPTAIESKLTIGVTTPYAKQQAIIADKVALTFSPEDLQYIQVLTVHKFQGSEVDILIFSPVLAQKGDGSSDYWYIHNKQLLNVAISRAKHLLLIVGDREFALKSSSKLKDVAEYCQRVESEDQQQVPNRPMNIFERQLLDLLKTVVKSPYKLLPQYVAGGRFSIDFALISNDKKIAIELDGVQHEIIGGIPVFADKQRDDFLTKDGWIIIRIPVYRLRHQPSEIVKQLTQAQTIAS